MIEAPCISTANHATNTSSFFDGNEAVANFAFCEVLGACGVFATTIKTIIALAYFSRFFTATAPIIHIQVYLALLFVAAFSTIARRTSTGKASFFAYFTIPLFLHTFIAHIPSLRQRLIVLPKVSYNDFAAIFARLTAATMTPATTVSTTTLTLFFNTKPRCLSRAWTEHALHCF